jgi:DNA helicase-2/ATP-dependent DNA helicase PcrA
MDINAAEDELITKEDQILKEVINHLENQKSHYIQRSKVETIRSRDLTARIVATRRDEEKAMLASDEAVSHALEERNQQELKRLTKLIKKPYFARIILHEQAEGKRKEIEYKIGYNANPDCRIIDWKKAPISKLFYEYKEGDEYCEEIQGKERNGKVALKNTYEIENSELKSIKCKAGNFQKKDGKWIKSSGNTAKSAEGPKDRMRDVLSLISAEQFRNITEDAQTAVLIQGIAGSGKTTVALHRLAWLLDPFNSELKAEDSLVLVQTSSLKTYILNTLSELDVEKVQVERLEDWTGKLLKEILPGMSVDLSASTSTSIERIKKSMALLNCIEEYNYTANSDKTLENIYLEILSAADQIIKHDETKLIDKELVKAAAARTSENFSAGKYETCDKAIIVRIHQLKTHSIPLPGNRRGRYKHIVIDEVQDTNVIELAAIMNSADAYRNLTIVGDTSQNTQRESTFPGWDNLRKFWDHKEELSTYVELKISHRSTLPIMKLADFIQGRQMVSNGREGRVPIWFKCQKENKGIESAIKWLSTAMERYPNSLTAVLCSSQAEAKYAASILQPTFSNSVRLATDDSFNFEAGIVVCEIKQVKGLEFFSVLLWNPSEKNYPKNESYSKNLLYIGITRAEENLCLVTWNKPSALLPDIRSSLVRGYSVAEEEDDS